MPIVSPTLLRQPLHYPRLLPKPNPPYPSPLPRKRVYSNLNDIRDLQREMDDLSDEENELEDLVRSYFYYHPLFLSLFLSLCACVCVRACSNYLSDDVDTQWRVQPSYTHWSIHDTTRRKKRRTFFFFSFPFLSFLFFSFRQNLIRTNSTQLLLLSLF